MAELPTVEPHVERPGPAEFRDPLVRRELQRASVWIGAALLTAGIIFLAQPLLLIIGGMVLAVVLDGGTRFLGRFLPIPRGWRLLLVILLGLGWNFGFIGATAMVTQCHTANERTRVQSFNDFLVFGSMAVASFSSGQLLASFGWTAVNYVVFPTILAAADGLAPPLF